MESKHRDTRTFDRQASRAGWLVLVGALLWLIDLFPDYYVSRGSLLETSLLFNVIPLPALVVAGGLLLKERGRVAGAGIAIGVALGGLPFVLDDATVVLQREDIQPALGFFLGIASSLVILIGAGFALWAIALHPGIEFVSNRGNVVIAGGVGAVAVAYAAGQLLPSVRISTALGSVDARTPFSDPDLFTLWVVLGVFINIAVPVGSAFLSDLRVMTAILSGLTIALVADLATTFETFGLDPSSGATVQAGPGTVLQTVALVLFVVIAIISGMSATSRASGVLRRLEEWAR